MSDRPFARAPHIIQLIIQPLDFLHLHYFSPHSPTTLLLIYVHLTVSHELENRFDMLLHR
jgi:hypothetical protein